MRCESIIPERTVPTHSEVVNVAADGEEPRYERVIHTETTPEHRCEADATMVSRSMRETEDGRWVKDGPDRAYCAACFVPGRMAHQDGSESQHPAMALAAYGG